MGAPLLTSDPKDDIDDDDNDSVHSDDETPQAGAPSNWSEKRRAQRAIFDVWLASSAGQEALKKKTKDGRTKDEADEQQSIHSLLAQNNTGPQIVRNPRDYQLELFERAKKENTIAVLDTGSGKTLIAVLLLRHMIDQEIERRAAGLPSKISFFLVASVTLVYQQFSVLENNLDHPVMRICGADGVDRWKPEHWKKYFYENKVIVCTAEILFQCLSRSYITMKQINLLIFDEAHHTKKNHSYARIVKDFYIPEDVADRPRIFGMTASPIDAKVDIRRAGRDLEDLLDCKIATTKDMSFTDAVNRPSEHILPYAPLRSKGFETILLQQLKGKYGDLDVFQKQFTRATEVARHLGRWCADSFLLHAFSHEKCKKYEVAIEKKFHAGGGQDVKQLDERLKQVRDAIDDIQAQGLNALATCDLKMDLSSKVLELRRYLDLIYERGANDRCIVFVEERTTARLLNSLFRKIGTNHLRSDFLVGSAQSGVDEDSFSFRQQVLTLMKFRKGELNCLFATSVAEEGLDVPDCNRVIRFDLYTTMIQFVQSRGRARKKNSQFISMIEQNNSVHRRTIDEVRTQEQAMRQFCDLLPEDRRLVGNEESMLQYELEKERKTLRHRTEPTTGAKLTYGNALNILANFVSAVPTESDEPQHPTYAVQQVGTRYRAEVNLPGNAPLQYMQGPLHSKKMLAKRGAAFDACIELRKKQYLDDHLMPVYQKKLPAMRNALLAVDQKKTNMYDMRIKPSIWAEQRGTLPTELWITIVDFPESLDRPHQPIALLTRTPMPQFDQFLVYLNDGRGTPVISASLHSPLSLADNTLEKLTEFTFRVFWDIFHKQYEEDVTKLSYWLAPATLSLPGGHSTAMKDACNASPTTVIDWQVVNEAYAKKHHTWSSKMPNEFLINKFLVDEYDGSRRFYSTRIDTTRKATDPIPAGVAKSKLTGTILDYSNSMWKKTREARAGTWDLSQPVMEAHLVLQRRNMLAAPDQKEVARATLAFLCPEPLSISILPPGFAASCFIWPAIIHRFESHLISIEGCMSIGIECGPTFALAAFTKDSDNQGEHGSEERVNFQRGMGENYERLEFIGDTFLKTATTISTFIMNPNENEFEFHVRRMQMLCNKNLYETALKYKLYEYIRSLAFNRRYWYPEGLKMLRGTGVKRGEEPKEMFHDARQHALGEKTIADVCEALIGAAFLTHHVQDGHWEPRHWEDAVQAVTKLVDSEDHSMIQWKDYISAYEKPSYQTSDPTAVQKDLAQKVEKEHAYHFTYPRLLSSAFLHPSMPYIYEKMPNYQRLEFLGDALLDQASITYLFYKYPTKDPQWLTEHKMAMVSNKFLGALCVNIGFHRHLRHHHALLQSQIQNYATELLEAKRVAGDSRDYWTTITDPPKCLPDIVEAYIGAMFIDSNFNYNVVQDFFNQHVKWYFEDMTIYDTYANNHPCTHLHNMLQTTFGCMNYRLMAREIPSPVGGDERKDVVAVVMIHDKVVAGSKGKSGRYAKLRVANKALEMLDGLAPFEFRARFGCSCKGVVETEVEKGEVVVGSDCAI